MVGENLFGWYPYNQPQYTPYIVGIQEIFPKDWLGESSLGREDREPGRWQHCSGSASKAERERDRPGEKRGKCGPSEMGGAYND